MNKYQVIITNNRITINMHPFRPNINKNFGTNNNLPPVRLNEYMSSKDYQKLLKRYQKKLFQMKIDSENTYFITITLKNNLDYNTLLNEFHRFYVGLNRKFGKFEYLRTIQFQECKKYHIHIIIRFYDSPNNLNKSVLEKMWKNGIVHLEPVDNVYNPIQYITRYDSNCIQPTNPHLTYFFKNSKIISYSKKFAIETEQTITYINNQQLEFILKTYFYKFNNKQGEYVRIDSHKFYNPKTYQYDTCCDRIFIQSDNDFIQKYLS